MELKGAFNVLLENIKERYHLRNLNIDMRIILNWICNKQCMRLT
jgi:hypothetical protein